MKWTININNLMKSLCLVSFVIGLCCECVLYGKINPRKIPNSGKFVLSEKIGPDLIKVSIYLKSVKITKTSVPAYEARENNCTYSRFPCSLVLNLTIELNGKHVQVGRTPFADLSDLTEAELKQKGSAYVLVLYGGDASESYIAKIEFDSKGVLTREIFSALAPDTILERTQFYDFEL